MHIARYICKTCSIRNVLFAFMVIFSIIPTLAIYFCFRTYTVNIVADKYINEYLMSLSKQVEYEFSFFEEQLTSNYLYITMNPEKISSVQQGKDIEKIMEEGFSGSECITGAQIIYASNVYSYGYGIEKLPAEITEDFLSTVDNKEFKMLPKIIECNNKKCVVSARQLHNYYTGNAVGYILFYSDENYVNSLYSNLQIDSISCYITLSDRVISCTDKSVVGKELFIPDFSAGDDKIFKNLVRTFEVPSAFTGNLKLTTVASYDDLFAITNMLKKFNAFMLLASIALSLLISTIISKNCLKSIRNANADITAFANSPETYRPKKCGGEIAAFENQFNDMVIRIKELMKKNEDEREQKHLARLCTLQAQIKHHFVYNALDIVCWKARETNQTEIEKIVLALASYFRISLSRGENYITVRDEISLVKNYVFIEKMRFNDMFDIEFDVEEDIMEMKMLKIILQPVVENCIKHGFKNISHKGIIHVGGYLSHDNTIVFDVTDNGCGIDDETLKNVFKNRDDKIGYGLFNISERLRFEYGNSGKISFVDTGENGTHVRICLGLPPPEKFEVLSRNAR